MAPFVFCPHCKERLVPTGGQHVRRTCTCGFVAYDNPVPVVAAIVEMDAGVVLARGRGWPRGMFGLPTGFLEAREAPDAAVAREVREELGIAVVDVALVGLFSFHEQNQLIIAYAMRGLGVIALGEELEEVKTIPRAKLRGWTFGTGVAVAAWLEGARS